MSEYRRNQELAEVRSHIEESALMLESKGLDTDLAINNAILQMGDPAQIGNNLTEEWKMSTKQYRSKLVSRIFTASILGALINFFILNSQTYIFKDIRFFHGLYPSVMTLPAMVTGLVSLMVGTIVGSAGLCIPIAIGLYLAKLMPKGSNPEAVIPVAVYTSICFEVMKLIPLIVGIRLGWMHNPIVYQASWAIDGILCFTAYVQMLAIKYGAGRPNSSNWKLSLD
jgi:hypothetical protein